MEENKELQTNEQKENCGKSFNELIINLSFALLAAGLLALLKIIIGFAGYIDVLPGVFALFIYGSAATGVVWNLLKAKGPSFEFIFSSVTLAVCLFVL